MINELLLLAHVICISLFAIVSMRLGEHALVCFTVVTIMLANLFVLKQIELFSFTATSADALAVGSMIGFNLLQEFYSRQRAKKTISITFVMLAMYAVLSRFHLWYEPSMFDQTHRSFNFLLMMAPWLIAGSILIWMGSLVIDFVLFGILQRIWPVRYLLLRNYCAIGASQGVDTFFHAHFLAWLGVIGNPLHVFLISFCIKFSITLVITPLVTTMARYENRM